jgi:hypothetical protein
LIAPRQMASIHHFNAEIWKVKSTIDDAGVSIANRILMSMRTG